MRASHWAFNLVANLVYAHWATVAPVVQQKVVAVEAEFTAALAAMDEKAAAILKTQGPAKAVDALTDFTTKTGDGLVDEWNRFFGCDLPALLVLTLSSSSPQRSLTYLVRRLTCSNLRCDVQLSDSVVSL